MNPGILFAVIAAMAFGAWSIFHQKASGSVNFLFGAIIISLTAVIIGTIFLLPQLKATTLFTDYKGILFAVLAGVCALSVDLLALKTYNSGVPISIGASIILGGSVAFATAVGFILGESITVLKVLGIALVVAGCGILGFFTS